MKVEQARELIGIRALFSLQWDKDNKGPFEASIREISPSGAFVRYHDVETDEIKWIDIWNIECHEILSKI